MRIFENLRMPFQLSLKHKSQITMLKKAMFILFFSAFLLLCMFIYHFPPHTNVYYPKCIFKQLTSFECPGCGGARAIYAILHGNIIQAADYNLLFVLLIPVFCIALAATFSPYLHHVWAVLNKPTFYLVLLLFFWIARNIHHFPFSILHSDT